MAFMLSDNVVGDDHFVFRIKFKIKKLDGGAANGNLLMGDDVAGDSVTETRFFADEGQEGRFVEDQKGFYPARINQTSLSPMSFGIVLIHEVYYGIKILILIDTLSASAGKPKRPWSPHR